MKLLGFPWMLQVKGGGDSWLADNRFSAVRASAVKRGTAAAPPANQTEASPAAPGDAKSLSAFVQVICSGHERQGRKERPHNPGQ